MDNRNMPAMPCLYHTDAMKQSLFNPIKADGLTKLETAAIAAMQGYMTSHVTGQNMIAKNAVLLANALFDELEKEKGQ